MADPIVTVATTEFLVVSEVTIEILEVAEQGPPGPPGPPGSASGGAGSIDGAFAIAARLGEIASDETAKTQARTNLGLQNIDGGTFN